MSMDDLGDVALGPRFPIPGSDSTQGLMMGGAYPDELPCKLNYADFWPACLHAEEGFTQVQFERFDTLVPRANAFLRERAIYDVVKCETLEKKVSSPEQLGQSNPKFDVPNASKSVYTVKGLRVWYSSDRKVRTHAAQIGYRNFLPRCLQVTDKHISFEDLSSTYNAINEDLMDKPLEGKIITVETVGLRPVRPEFDDPEIHGDFTQWQDGPKFHVFYFTRVFYLFECPSYEQVGAADFLPDFVGDMNNQKSTSPKYSDFCSIIVKVNNWLEKVKDIRITNLQTLEASFPGLAKADKVNSSTNFHAKADTGPMIRFVRVSYVRPKYGLPPGGLTVPRVITYKTFLPASTCAQVVIDVIPEFEPMTSLWERVRNWLRESGDNRHIIGVELQHHPLPLLMKKKDNAESTVIKGTWIFPPESSTQEIMQRVPMLEIIRVYFNDAWRTEPGNHGNHGNHAGVGGGAQVHHLPPPHTSNGQISNSSTDTDQSLRPLPRKGGCVLL